MAEVVNKNKADSVNKNKYQRELHYYAGLDTASLRQARETLSMS